MATSTSNYKAAGNTSLSNISWSTYQALLSDLGEHSSALLAYQQGVLEIKMPLAWHEFVIYLLERIIIVLTEELGLSVRGFGSTTLNREDLYQIPKEKRQIKRQ